jgi:Flp pilus assembly pilin Flp
MILVLISLACMIAFVSLGVELTDIFTTATNAMAAA